MQFTFNSKFVGFGSPETNMTFECDQIEDVVSYFEQFLQGAGFTWLKPGQIQFIDEVEEGCTSCQGCTGGCGR